MIISHKLLGHTYRTKLTLRGAMDSKHFQLYILLKTKIHLLV